MFNVKEFNVREFNVSTCANLECKTSNLEPRSLLAATPACHCEESTLVDDEAICFKRSLTLKTHRHHFNQERLPRFAYARSQWQDGTISPSFITYQNLNRKFNRLRSPRLKKFNVRRLKSSMSREFNVRRVRRSTLGSSMLLPAQT